MNDLLARISKLSAGKRALLLSKYPLSFAQERLWFLDQLEPGSAAYNVPAALRFEGILDVGRLKSGLARLLERHSVLRTNFPSIEGQPIQLVAAPAPVRLPVVDLSSVAAPTRHAWVRRLASEEAGRSFDLARGPLLAFVLLRLGRREHVLLTTLHHIVCDGWSLEILFAELQILYQADIAGRPRSLADLPLQYVDYARWQRRRLVGEALEEQLAFWKSQLEPLPPLLELPVDRPRPADASHRGAWNWSTLPVSLTAAVRSLSRERRSTLFMTLLAVFKLLVYRLSGQLDFAVGTPIVNRPRIEIEQLVGFFLNTLVLRTPLSGELCFAELLERVRQQTLSAHSHQELPFEKLTAELDVERDLNHQPLFQVMFTLKGAPPAPPQNEGLTISRFHEVELRVAAFDLLLTVVEGVDEVVNALEYSCDLFDETTIRRWLRSFELLVAQVVEDPERRLRDFTLLSREEHHQILAEWNDTASPATSETVYSLFETQALAAPGAVAVEWRGQFLSYAALDQRACRLARRLTTFGVGPETLVGVALERTPEMIVGILAILKAGGAYLPLDSRLPSERIAFMVGDSRVDLVLCGGARKVELGALDVRLLDPGVEGVPAHSEEILPAPHPDNPAYVIYTSGSTGRPKGVAVTQRALAAYLRTLICRFALKPSDRVLQFASLSFDVSAEEIFGTLATGATLVLPEEAVVLSPGDFCAHVAALRMTVLILPTAYWHELAASSDLELPSTVELVVIGGEKAAASRLVDWWHATDPEVRLLNAYGPTETTIAATCQSITRRPLSRGGEIPIGRPLGNVRARVAGARLDAVPVGTHGELYIAGAGLARGYLHRSGLTAERFVPDPGSPDPGGRLYRTGDRVRLLPDGALGFVGRVDHQVKVRGFRIETGEIEVALLAQRTVREAAVVALGADSGLRLVAFCVPEGASATSEGTTVVHQEVRALAQELRAALGRRLPEYMVPSEFRFLTALPKTPSDKIDLRALMDHERGKDSESGEMAPRGAVEELLANIWAEVLEAESIGREADFFALGGHSLLATRVVSRLRKELAVELSVRELFESPTVAALARRITELDGRRAIVAAPQIEPRGRDDNLPLSFAQQRLWVLDRLDPGNTTYNLPSAFHLEGTLAVGALERAVGEVVRRHETLRTTFEATGGKPVQRIEPARSVSLPVIDLSALSKAARVVESQRLIDFEACLPFDLQQGPLWRCIVVCLGPADNVVSLVLHHIVSDGWSSEILLSELAMLYRAYAAGERSPLPELPVQYGDFTLWQRRWLDGATLERLLTFWRREQAGPPPVLELPIDRPRPPKPSFVGGRLWRRLPAGVATGLERLGRDARVTRFMTYLAASAVLLSRYSGQRDFNVGTPVAGRDRLEIEGLIGFFVNALVLRAPLAGDPTFWELLGRVRERMLDAQAHQDVPFEGLVEALDPERDQSHTPLFQVWLIAIATPPEPRPFADLALTNLHPNLGRSKFDWTIAFLEDGEDLTAGIEYVTALFDATTVQRVLRHVEILLSQVIADPGRGLSQLDLLTASERHQMLVEWSDMASSWHRGDSLVTLFEAQVDRTPAAVAVRRGDRVMSYAELDRHANQLAHALRDLGVGCESMVGLCVERGVDMVWAAMGILKAGATYLALDPTYPPERIGYVLADAGSDVVVCHASVEAVLPADHGTTVLRLETGYLAACCTTRPALRIDEEQLAYVLYTSGSTGRPKGVAIAHKSAVVLVRWSLATFEREAFDGMLGATSLAFDLSIFELFATLSCGGTILVATDALELATLSDRDRVRLVNTVPSVMDELVRGDMIGPRVHTVTLAGEPLSRELADAIIAGGVDQLFTLYGPSEDTTWSSGRLMIPGEIGRPPIGRPLADTQLHILDRQVRPIPIGAVGEIYLGGRGLARGYLGRSSLTAERFVPDPYGPSPGRRLYLSGDLGRFLTDGASECLGRVDHQVKIRGFRVELGEIETALRALSGVEEAAVMVREVSGSGRVLVAYVAGGDELDEPGQLRESLRRRLPDYMIPTYSIRLDGMPRTPNGKIDRHALPDPERTVAAAEEMPQGLTEEMLATIWREVLAIDSIGRQQDFFDLGGHSLLATQVTSRIREAFDVELSMRALFDAPTVAELAALVAAEQRERSAAAIPQLKRYPRIGDLPLSFTQQRLWFLDRLEGTSAAYNLPATFRWSGALDLLAFHGALNELARRHEALRTSFRLAGEEPVQVVAERVQVALPVVDLSALDLVSGQNELLRLARDEVELPFDLSSPPLLRACVLRMAADDHAVVLTLHHIVADGWSMGVLRREVGALYEGLRQGIATPLPDLPVQVADFAIWQRQWLQGRVLEAELTYWRGVLAGAPELLELPTDRPRPSVQTYDGAWLGIELRSPLTVEVGALAQGAGATLFMAFLAGFEVLLGRFCRVVDLCVGTPISGRTRLELEPLIGFFANTLVLRGDLSGSPSFEEFLGRMREVTLGAFAHQEVPFETLVSDLAPERSLGYSPLFQVLFSLQEGNGGKDQIAGTGGASVSPFQVHARTAKFDLSLALQQRGRHWLAGFEFNTNLFDATTIERLARAYERLLKAVVVAPSSPLSELSLLSPTERHQVLVEWNDTVGDRAPITTLVELLETQIDLIPDAVAVRRLGSGLTYGELERRANRLAHHLRTLGVEPEETVGLCVERGVEMVWALLGILKAGGAYVALDPAYPSKRVRFMLADAGARVVVTTSTVEHVLPADHQARRVRLDTEWPMIAARGPQRPVRCSVGSHLAYILYTSGSTGLPKGVAIPHTGAVALVRWSLDVFSGEALSGVLAATSLCFDLSVYELFAPLVAGGQVIVATDALELPSLPEAREVKLINTVPSVMAELLRQGTLPTRVTTVNLAGEPLPRDLVEALYRSGVEVVYNLYGPSEDTTYSTFARIPGGRTDRPSIGRPIDGTRFAVVDDRTRPVPIGGAGELCLGGQGLARGYRGRSDLTAERFVPDPLGTEFGARLYRTGDAVRLLADGELDFLGRLDHQVKVRGFRIEPGEIEAALRAQPGVDEAVVVARQSATGDFGLVAYVVTAVEVGPELMVLRDALRAALPEPMVPTTWVRLESVPRTPSGKIDRRALPVPEQSREYSKLVPPRTQEELVLARIWADVLGVDAVGVTDDFFDLGGHSLLAVRLQARIRAELGVDLPLVRFFEGSTVERLAARLDTPETARSPSSLVPIQPKGQRFPLFLVHPVGGSVFCYSVLARHLGIDQPVYGFAARGLDGTEAPLDRIEKLAAAYLDEMLTLQPAGPFHLGGWSMGGLVAFEMARQLEADGHEVGFLGLIDTPAPDPVETPVDENTCLVTFARDLGLGTASELVGEENDRDIVLSELLAQAQSQGRIPPELEPSRFRAIYRVFESNFRASLAYAPAAYGGSLTVFEAQESLGFEASHRGWEELTRGRATTHAVPGNHYTLLSDPGVGELARLLTAGLRADRG